ncbi:MAG: hypothetical protein U9N34_10640, partial [Candidatus Cloacimonadota bacterium]|nr:hypothetical protein [Candidatus Cloacimonadota bacterium]
KYINRNNNRQSKKTVETFDNYLDHRQCISCGYEWGIIKKQSRGSEQKNISWEVNYDGES